MQSRCQLRLVVSSASLGLLPSSSWFGVRIIFLEAIKRGGWLLQGCEESLTQRRPKPSFKGCPTDLVRPTQDNHPLDNLEFTDLGP